MMHLRIYWNDPVRELRQTEVLFYANAEMLQ